MWTKIPIQAFWRCCSGATSIEYSIIGAGIAIAIVAGAQSTGLKLNTIFTNVQNGLK